MKNKLLYEHIKEEIELKIKDGVYKPSDKLPSEPELAKEFKVSRQTLREALKMLQREGVLVSKNGVGTYINSKTSLIENPLSKLQSLGTMIKNAGYKESESNVKIYSRDALQEWKEKLGIDERVLVLERSRTADERVVAFYYNIFPESIAANYFNDEFSGSIFDFLQKNLDVKISSAITEICAVGRSKELDKHAIKLLGSEVLLLKQLHMDERNKPIFYSLDYLKNDVFKLFIKRE